VAIACGGARPKTSAAPPSAAELGSRDPHAEIEGLDRQIADEMARAQIAQPATAACTGAACAQAMSQPFAAPVDDPSCRPAASEKCTTTCTLATSICNNQQKICELAKQLEGDDWAAGKCESARQSCKAAHDSCCSCVL
jgi:hypothetical protein